MNYLKLLHNLWPSQSAVWVHKYGTVKVFSQITITEVSPLEKFALYGMNCINYSHWAFSNTRMVHRRYGLISIPDSTTSVLDSIYLYNDAHLPFKLPTWVGNGPFIMGYMALAPFYMLQITFFQRLKNFYLQLAL